MRIENGKVYASKRVARFWRPILQPIVDFLGQFLTDFGVTGLFLAVIVILWVNGS